MKRYDPQSPEANVPGDHPISGERKGLWKVLVVSFVLAVAAVFGAGIYFGAFETGIDSATSDQAVSEADPGAAGGAATR